MSAAGQRARLELEIKRTRALIDALESSIHAGIPLSDLATTVACAGLSLATNAAQHDAYTRAGVR